MKWQYWVYLQPKIHIAWGVKIIYYWNPDTPNTQKSNGKGDKVDKNKYGLTNSNNKWKINIKNIQIFWSVQ